MVSTTALRRILGRRDVLSGLAGLGLFAAGFSHAPVWAEPRLREDPFTLGVASGDPHPDGVVLWTRLAPEPLALDGHGGMPNLAVPVRWEVALDERFRRVVQRGEVLAVPELAHAVHVEVRGLRPNWTYFYRFRAGRFVSPVGRTKTAPAPGTPLTTLRVGVASCQVWWGGFYTAYRHMSDDDLAVVLHLGDYIYENTIPADGLHRKVTLPTEIRTEPWTLTEYRLRYALFRTDPDLQAAHAALPFVVTWDDHEVDDNWAGDFSRDLDVDPATFRQRRAAAAQAYYEHLPLRLPQKPNGADIRLYRRLTYGDLVTVHVLDERSYRDDQACGDGQQEDCAERLDPTRTMLGAEQERWLAEGLTGARTRWNLLANQVPMSQFDLDVGDPLPLFMDAWDGYPAARRRILDVFAARPDLNPVVVTGDRHRHIAAELKLNFDDPDSATVGVEFGGTSISSDQDGEDLDPHSEVVLAANPHVRFMNHQRGYLRLTLTREQCRADHLVMPYVSRPGAPIAVRASFVTEAGKPGLQLDTQSRV